ncbi:MAG TPA: hypothetical protein VFV52_07300 [Bacilli bacterium]|nr:hypothetical protein [Bacilli bacterium]
MYRLGDVAKKLGIKSNKVKSTTRIMEEEGFEFARDSRNFRLYSDEQIEEIARRRNVNYPMAAVEEDEDDLYAVVKAIPIEDKNRLLVRYMRKYGGNAPTQK